MEFWVLVIGLALIAIFVPEIKTLDRRPAAAGPARLGRTARAFPSGHAAQATLYTWLAVTFALRVVPGITRRSLVIAAGIVLTVLIGADPRLPAGPLDERRLFGLGARASRASRRSPSWCSSLDTSATIPGVMTAAPQLDPGAGAGARALSTTSSRPPELLSVCAFVGLILVPALGSYGRAWEKLVAGFLSLFVLAALVLIGLVIGVVIFLNWDEISNWI